MGKHGNAARAGGVAGVNDGLDLGGFTRELIGDLRALRAGEITVAEARVRAQIGDLRALRAGEFFADRAKQLPPAGGEGAG